MKKHYLAAAAALGLALGAHAQNSSTGAAATATARAESASARVELAVQYFQAGRVDVAQEELQKVLSNDPKNSMANDLLGVIRQREGNTPQAEAAFRTAIASDAGNASAHNNYGLLLCTTGRHDAGLESFGRALQSPTGIQVSQTLVNGGVCLAQKGDQAGAEKFFVKALEVEPFMPSALFQLAKVYLATNRPSQAESRLTALHRQAEPNSASTYLMYQVALALNKPAQVQNIARVLQTRFADSAETQRLPRN